MCGFGNAISLSDCTDKDIADIEKFMREEWAVIMKKKSDEKNYSTQMVNYFGELYSENATQFEFKRGDKKIINGIVFHVKSIIESSDDNGLKHFTQNSIFNECSVSKTQQPSIQSNVNMPKNAERTHYFLNKLQSAAKQNENRQTGGYRYDPEIKSIGLYLRLLTGPLAYETIQKNLDCSLPSLSSTNRYISLFGCQIVEGIVRSYELQQYLNDRKLPLVVCLSMDETRIEDEVQYDAKTNQIVGFTLPLNRTTGLPIPCAYPARNVEEIMKHFSVENRISSNLNVVMAQPLAHNVPAFCLLAYGTDKRYNSTDVSNQWKNLTQELASVNIKVLSISSDSDPKYNAAMRYHSKLGMPSDLIRFAWFSSAANDDETYCIQDPEHIGTKLRNFLLRTTWNQRKLPFGTNNYIQLNHLYFIMNRYKKDRHELTKSVLNPVDKQNFKSVERMCSVKVTNLLKLHPNFQATMYFLETIRDVIDAFRNKKLTPLERIRKMWYQIFILRLWRRYILRDSRYTLENNFLTTYAYTCIELNGHSLVQIILYLRKIDRPELFLPHYFGSQQCESIFRQMRSLTSTYSTIANCSAKGALSRLSKIQIQNDIIQSSTNFKFPRHETKNKTPAETFPLPSLQEIVQEIEKCTADAIDVAQRLNLITENDLNDKELLSCKISPYSPPPNVEKDTKSNINMRPLKVSDFDGITLKNFSSQHAVVNESGPYVELRFDDYSKRVVVRKSTFVWLLRKDKQRISSDRLRRVQCSSSSSVHRVARIKKNNQCKNVHKQKKILHYPYQKLRSRKI